jgi:C_GCAxxG_C_C family probable redox protein
MTDAGRNAREYLASDYNCAQSVLKAVLEEKGAFFDEAMSLSSGFGGGIAGEGRTCGAVSGAIMAIGVLNGLHSKDVVKSKERTYKISSILIERLKKKFGSTQCYELIGVDMQDSEAKKAARERGVFSDQCSEFVATAAKIVLDLFSQ